MRGVAFAVFVVVFGAFVMLCTGCSGGWHPHDDPSGSTSTGEGGSGGDIFTTTGGDGGGPVCAGACVAGKPAWFDGLSLFWIGPPDEAPPCSDLGLSEGSTGYADPVVAPPMCPSCSCSPAACVLPEAMHASAAKCADADGAASTPFDAPAGWEGTCSTDNAIAGGLSCGGVPCVQSLTIAAPEVAPCMPATDADPVIPPHAWGKVARECVIWPISGEGCETGRACVPIPSDRYAVCVYRYGDHTADPGFACPAEYPRSLVVYASYEDTRECAPCKCGDPEGGECAAFVSVYKDGACGTVLGSYTLTSDMGEGCFDLPPGSALGSKSASLLVDQPGSCKKSGGGPVGAFEPADPVTLCCQPDPDPTP